MKADLDAQAEERRARAFGDPTTRTPSIDRALWLVCALVVAASTWWLLADFSGPDGEPCGDAVTVLGEVAGASAEPPCRDEAERRARIPAGGLLVSAAVLAVRAERREWERFEADPSRSTPWKSSPGRRVGVAAIWTSVGVLVSAIALGPPPGALIVGGLAVVTAVSYHHAYEWPRRWKDLRQISPFRGVWWLRRHVAHWVAPAVLWLGLGIVAQATIPLIA